MRKFYTVGSCVRLIRSDSDGNEHDEFIYDAKSTEDAFQTAESLNKGGLDRISIPQVGLRNLMRRGYGDYYPPREETDFTHYVREDRYDEAVFLLKQILQDLPAKRDWLDPSIERQARSLTNLLGLSHVEKGGTIR